MLVDGDRHQLDAIHAEAQRRKADLHIIIDFVHVLKCLWRAAWCLRPRPYLNTSRYQLAA